MLFARRAKTSGYIVIAIMLLALYLWAIRHVSRILSGDVLNGSGELYFAYLFTFGFFALTLFFASLERPIKGKVDRNRYNIAVIVPAYNEDEELLKNCLNSIINQTVKPDQIFVVDDGSTTSKYADVKKGFKSTCKSAGIKASWRRKKNGGKRSAQAIAIKNTPDATIYITVDSDSVLDNKAIAEGMKPFEDPEVKSVAGLVMAINNRHNLLARITDLLFVTGQLIDRSAMSYFGSVLVNSGGLAFYRADIVRKNMKTYLNESFFGKHIEFSDDSMLTLFSLVEGKTVQQSSAFVFTMMPDNVSHHLRQQNRWMKGSFIRSWWRLRYLPLWSPGFIRQAVSWIQFVTTLIVFAVIFVYQPIFNQALVPYAIFVPILLSYIQGLRYFSFARSDQSFESKFLTYMLSPLALLWSFFVFRPLRLYAMATCLNNGWGTRSKVEIGLSS